MARRPLYRLSWLLVLAHALPAQARMGAPSAVPGGGAPAAAARAGELWEQVREVSFQGRSFTHESVVCMPKGDWSRAPVDGDDRCRMTDTTRSGSTWAWKVTCTDGSAGTGQATRTGDTMTASLRVHVAQAGGEMTTHLRGRRRGGACDPDAARAEVEARAQEIQRISEISRDVTARACHEMALQTNPGLFLDERCASAKPVFCATLETAGGFERLQELPAASRSDALARCGTTDAQLRAKLCAARTEQIRPVETEEVFSALDFVAAHCPQQARAIAQRECAGRSFTGSQAVAPWVFPFCQGYASQVLRQDGAAGSGSSSGPLTMKKPRRRIQTTGASTAVADASASRALATDADGSSGDDATPPGDPPASREKSVADHMLDAVKKQAAQEAVDQARKGARKLFGF